MNLYPFFRFLLFRLDPELAHQLTIRLIRTIGDIQPLAAMARRSFSAPGHPVSAFGLEFSNSIGLAAGYDKDGLGWRGLACLGFGHIEIGTVTPKPQPGNPQPRLFRLTSEKALINRLGFPGKGAEYVLRQISKPRPNQLILGVNIGKNKDTSLDAAVEDYLYLLRLFSQHVDYVAVNVSSPNTIGLRQLQERHELDQLLGKLDIEREKLNGNSPHRVPILVKLAPDLSDIQLEDALQVMHDHHMDGVIATNTTVSRTEIRSSLAREEGGLSGQPLFNMSLAMVAKIYAWTNGKLPVIGVGGVSDATCLQKMLDAGAVLVQLYTGLIYDGPGLVKRILSDSYRGPIHSKK